MRSLQRRKFTDEQKLVILDEAARKGINNVLREHKLSYSVFSKWKVKLQPHEIAETRKRSETQQQLRNLVAENDRLRKIIANMALELQISKEKLLAKA